MSTGRCRYSRPVWAAVGGRNVHLDCREFASRDGGRCGSTDVRGRGPDEWRFDAGDLRVRGRWQWRRFGAAGCRSPGRGAGLPAIVENRSGASGRIGTRAVVTAAPDGNTLLVSAMGPVALHPIVYSNLDFDPISDLAPLSQLATFDIALALSAGHSAMSVSELVTWIRANPDRANYGTPGLGGLPHFFAVMFSTAAGVQLRNVPRDYPFITSAGLTAAIDR